MSRPTNKNAWLKPVYEETLGKQVSRTTWYRVMDTMEFSDVEMTADSVVALAKLKKQLPSIDTLLLIRLLKSNQLITRAISGEELFNAIRNLVGWKLKDSTILMWFKTLQAVDGNKFSKERIYTAEEAFVPLAKALLHTQRRKKAER